MKTPPALGTINGFSPTRMKVGTRTLIFNGTTRGMSEVLAQHKIKVGSNVTVPEWGDRRYTWDGTWPNQVPMPFEVSVYMDKKKSIAMGVTRFYTRAEALRFVTAENKRRRQSIKEGNKVAYPVFLEENSNA